jgi:hypothetical protein
MSDHDGAASLVRSDALLARLGAEAQCRHEDTHGKQLIDDAILEIRCLRAALEESHRMQKIMVAGMPNAPREGRAVARTLHADVGTDGGGK